MKEVGPRPPPGDGHHLRAVPRQLRAGVRDQAANTVEEVAAMAIAARERRRRRHHRRAAQRRRRHLAVVSPAAVRATAASRPLADRLGALRAAARLHPRQRRRGAARPGEPARLDAGLRAGACCPGWLQGLVDFGIYREGELPIRPPAGGRAVRRLLLHQPLALPGGGGADGDDVEAFDAALLGNAAVAPPYEPHPDDPCPECSAKVGADDRRDPRPRRRSRRSTPTWSGCSTMRRDRSGPGRAVRRRAGRARPLVPARARQRVQPARLLDARLRRRPGDAGASCAAAGRAGRRCST